MTPKVGDSFGNYYSRLEILQKKADSTKTQTEYLKSRWDGEKILKKYHTTDGKFVGTSYYGQHAYIDEKGDVKTKIRGGVYDAESRVRYVSDDIKANNERITTIKWDGFIARDLNGNGIIDDGEITPVPTAQSNEKPVDNTASPEGEKSIDKTA